MKTVFLVRNSDGQVIKALSSLELAFDFIREHNFRYDYRELTDVIEIEIDGDTWGTRHSLEEMGD